jgi:phenylpropionate dioxygenase-like ring-hydroxylating dioxygenase large terminal subunit
MDLARRALERYGERGTDQADAPMVNPVSAYLDPARYAHEIEHCFKRRPMALALSLELAEPGDYRAVTVLETPVLMVRGKDGQARAFLNVCRHRGAPLCDEGTGSAQRFSCPYHAWAYDAEGALTAMYGDATFGDINRADYALKPLPCAEAAGLVWVCLTPGLDFDIDAWLGGMRAELETLELDAWHIHEVRDLPGPGWKVVWDGYLEAYHHNTLHKDTVGKFTVGNLVVHDTYGPHQRITFGRRSLKELAAQPESEWAPDKHIRLIHSVFPNLSISGVLGDHCLVSHLFPGPDPDTTITRQYVLSAKKPETPDEVVATEGFSDIVLRAVQDEDYDMGYKIQRGLKSGANTTFTYGRNEPGLHHYHRMVAELGGWRGD